MRSILDTLLYELPKKLYGELLASVTAKHNILPTSNHPTKTPAVLFGGEKLNLNEAHLIPFGSLCMFLMPGNENLGKMDARSQYGVSMGPSKRSRQSVRAYIFLTESVVVRERYEILNALPFGFNWILKRPVNNFKNSNKINVHEEEFQAVSKLLVSEPILKERLENFANLDIDADS